MTNATFYRNGFVITEHTRSDICSELSMFAWTITQIMLNIDRKDGEYVTNEVTGYGHFTFNHENPSLEHIFSIATQMLPMWAEKYAWGGYVEIKVNDGLFKPNYQPNSAETVNAEDKYHVIEMWEKENNGSISHKIIGCFDSFK